MEYTHLAAPLLQALAQTINEGLVLVDGEGRIQLWNRWLAERSGIAAETAVGRRLQEAIPSLANSRLLDAVHTALRQQLPAVLSPTLNRRPFPLHNPQQGQAQPMEQAITVAPLSVPPGLVYCLIQIQDVTSAVRREKQLREQAQQLQALSNIDGLTGVANRRSFDARFQEEFQRAQRHGTTISVLMLDIDFFKEYNDGYGHQAGDTCLTVVANTLKRCLQRSSDFVARYGGEEFAVVLPDTDLAAAALLAETLRQQVVLLGIPHVSSQVAPHVSVSIGATSHLPGRLDRAQDLLRVADVALYQAKRLGRNQVVSSDAREQMLAS